ncbi:MAG TPA: DNA polymerase IV [Mycobacteriales bacterium]|nr:DNA polymerase IV [Mycobacteriales bacterium]
MSRRQLQREPPPDLPGDDRGCVILHADMDAFYASVELRRRPDLVGRPVVVGHDGARAVVLAATYEARAFGVHSAMPMMRARRLCPGLIIVEPDHDSYAEASAAVMAIFRSITPLVEPLALDEAFLDVGGARRRVGSPRTIAELIRTRIAEEQRLPCSVGVAPTKFVAKLASSRAKPDGLLVVPRGAVTTFLHALPVGALWGVGERTEQRLDALGLRTIGDIARTPESTLVHSLGAAVGAHLHALAWGRDPRPVVPHEPERSIGAEETFARDLRDGDDIRRELLRLSERVAARLRRHRLAGRTVSVKIRFSDFTTINRSKSLPAPSDTAAVIYDVACRLYAAAGCDGAPLRLVGVRLEGLVDAGETPQQLSLGSDDEWRQAELAVDRAAARYGPGAVRRGTLVDPDRPSGH